MNNDAGIMIPASEPVIQAAILSTFPVLVQARGIDFARLMDDVGLPRDALDDPANELPLRSVAHLMELAAERHANPSFGLEFAESFPPGASGLVGYATLHAGTIGQGLEAMARYAALICHPNPIRIREEGGATALSWSFPTDRTVCGVQFTSFINAILVLRLKRMVGRSWTPLAVEVDHSTIPCPRRLRRIFGSRITFNARENTILIDRATMQQATRGADPQLYRILQEIGETKLQELGERPDLVSQTARAITETLSTHPPLLEHIAERMGTTPRTLQNRLAQHGTTFERVLRDTRRRLAERYLRETDLLLTEIAYLLGFSEQSAFTRAARTWFGRPPRQLRKESGQVARMERAGHD